ncbi:MAG: creatininase family protein [Myxococcota bacterium]
MTYRLAAMSYEQAAERAGAVCFLPTGATEAHGPHLPLSTDVIISEEGAVQAAKRLDEDGIVSVVLPPLAYAVTEFASPFAGTISLPFDTAKALIRDVIVGAKRAGFGPLVICNAHLEPDNLRALREGTEEARAHGAVVAFPDITRKPHALRLGDEFRSGACHAGQYETSLVLAAKAEWVKPQHRELDANPNSLSVAIRAGKKNFLEAGGERAYFGYPADASVGEGVSLYAEHAAIFADAARELLAR